MRRVLACVGAALLAACGGQAGPAAEELVVPAVPARSQTVPSAALPASAGGVDMLCALLPPSRLAGLPDQALQYSAVRDPDSPYLKRPRFDRYLAEPILALKPDLVLASATQSADTTAALERMGVTVVTWPDPREWHDVLAQLEELGELLGVQARAHALIRSLEQRAAALAATAERRAGLRVLPYTNAGSGGWTAGRGTTADLILGLAGLTNAAAEVGRSGHSRIRYEELLELDPDLFLVSAPSTGPDPFGSEAGGITATVLRDDPVLATLSAVKQGGIVAIEGWLYTTTSHELLTAAEQVAAQADAFLERRGR